MYACPGSGRIGHLTPCLRIILARLDNDTVKITIFFINRTHILLLINSSMAILLALFSRFLFSLPTLRWNVDRVNATRRGGLVGCASLTRSAFHQPSAIRSRHLCHRCFTVLVAN